MKLIILLIAFTVFTFSGFSRAAECTGPKNFIFLVHGIGGDAATFGSMSDILLKKDPCYKPSSFVYETGSMMTVHEFSDSLDAFIKNTLEASAAHEQDKISFIMHSQGGLVVSLWLKKALSNHDPLFNRVDSFITLSTPFWGSSLAKWGRRIFYTLPKNKALNPISPFGKFELLDMSYGSPTISELNHNYLDVFNAGKHIRGLSIGGLKAAYNSKLGEDDTTVSAYSSRPDHYLVNSTLDLAGTISSEPFVKTEFHPYVMVRATHFATTDPGVADIPVECLVACDHPSLPYILDHLEKKPILSSSTEVFKLKKFRVHVYLEGLEQHELSGNDVRFAYSLRSERTHRVGKRKRRSEIGHSFTGFTNGAGKEEMILMVKIKGVEKGELVVPVEGGYSTFLNLKIK